MHTYMIHTYRKESILLLISNTSISLRTKIPNENNSFGNLHGVIIILLIKSLINLVFIVSIHEPISFFVCSYISIRSYQNVGLDVMAQVK